ncbi:MAG TPA: di-trans,poly-cis-decaprenylcistransferase [Dehalococcoidia bacterium]|nr:di-trans,poly-cis-decaprenylcistransferase [Dehalococcoidia bacterium]
MKSEMTDLPQHVAIIMDGNSRWASKCGLSRVEGHRAGARIIRHVVEIIDEYQIQYLTLFAFSTENWDRPRNEIRSLMQIFGNLIDSELQLLHEKGIRLYHLGLLFRLPVGLQRKVKGAIELTKWSAPQKGFQLKWEIPN